MNTVDFHTIALVVFVIFFVILTIYFPLRYGREAFQPDNVALDQFDFQGSTLSFGGEQLGHSVNYEVVFDQAVPIDPGAPLRISYDMSLGQIVGIRVIASNDAIVWSKCSGVKAALKTVRTLN